MYDWYERNQEQIERKEAEKLDYVRKNGLSVYNYPGEKKWDQYFIETGHDEENGFNYAVINNRKVYFDASWNIPQIERYCRTIYREQDPASPHCYGIRSDPNETYDYVIDAGCAEGYYAINYLPYTGKMIVIESDAAWLNTYQYTFSEELATEKLQIINHFLYDGTYNNNISLNDIYHTCMNSDAGKKILIKMDIEGAEEKALQGAADILNSNNNIRLVICTYHHFDSFDRIRRLLEGYHFKINHSDGFMFFLRRLEKETVDQPIEFTEDRDINYRLRVGVIYADNVR